MKDNTQGIYLGNPLQGKPKKKEDLFPFKLENTLNSDYNNNFISQ